MKVRIRESRKSDIHRPEEMWCQINHDSCKCCSNESSESRAQKVLFLAENDITVAGGDMEASAFEAQAVSSDNGDVTLKVYVQPQVTHLRYIHPGRCIPICIYRHLSGPLLSCRFWSQIPQTLNIITQVSHVERFHFYWDGFDGFSRLTQRGPSHTESSHYLF